MRKSTHTVQTMTEKESDETVALAKKEWDETVTTSRADTISRTKRGANDVQL